MFGFFILALQFVLIVLKVIGVSTIGWLATFYPAIGYVAFVAAVWVSIAAFGFFFVAAAAVTALFGRRKLR
jgi:hypothetical protein